MPSRPPAYKAGSCQNARRAESDRAYGRHRMGRADLARAKTIRSSKRWQEFRLWFLRRHPLCVDPLGVHGRHGQVVAATQVHHRVRLRDAPELWAEENNCMAVCTHCHAAIERNNGRRG